MDIKNFLCEHRATLTELCEPYIANFKDEFNSVDASYRDELVDEFQDMCRLEIAEYIGYYLSLDYVSIQEVLEDLDMFTYLDLNV